MRHSEEHCDTRGGDPIEQGVLVLTGISDVFLSVVVRTLRCGCRHSLVSGAPLFSEKS